MRILVGVDFSKPSETIFKEVARRPWPASSEFRLVSVAEPLDVAASLTFVPEFLETKTQAARARIELMAAKLATERGLPVSSAVIPGSPRSALNEYAAHWKADLVVVGSRGYGAFRRLLLGSVAAAVVRRAPCSVEIVRPGPGGKKRAPGMRILLATDGSRYSVEAARSVARRPWPAGSRLRVVSVAEPARPLANPWSIPPGKQARLDRATRQAAREAKETACRILERALPVSTAVLAGDPRRRLVEECRRWRADLLVVGSHGRREIDRLLLGSVSEAVAVHAPCSVEVVRGSSGERSYRLQDATGTRNGALLMRKGPPPLRYGRHEPAVYSRLRLAEPSLPLALLLSRQGGNVTSRAMNRRIYREGSPCRSTRRARPSLSPTTPATREPSSRSATPSDEANASTAVRGSPARR